MYEYIGLHVKYALFLSHFNETGIFSIDFGKTFKYEISRKSVPLERKYCMRTDGRTDRHDEANSRFSQFCERVSKWPCTTLCLCLPVRVL